MNIFKPESKRLAVLSIGMLVLASLAVFSGVGALLLYQQNKDTAAENFALNSNLYGFFDEEPYYYLEVDFEKINNLSETTQKVELTKLFKSMGVPPLSDESPLESLSTYFWNDEVTLSSLNPETVVVYKDFENSVPVWAFTNISEAPENSETLKTQNSEVIDDSIILFVSDSEETISDLSFTETKNTERLTSKANEIKAIQDRKTSSEDSDNTGLSGNFIGVTYTNLNNSEVNLRFSEQEETVEEAEISRNPVKLTSEVEPSPDEQNIEPSEIITPSPDDETEQSNNEEPSPEVSPEIEITDTDGGGASEEAANANEASLPIEGEMIGIVSIASQRGVVVDGSLYEVKIDGASFPNEERVIADTEDAYNNVFASHVSSEAKNTTLLKDSSVIDDYPASAFLGLEGYHYFLSEYYNDSNIVYSDVVEPGVLMHSTGYPVPAFIDIEDPDMDPGIYSPNGIYTYNQNGTLEVSELLSEVTQNIFSPNLGNEDSYVSYADDKVSFFSQVPPLTLTDNKEITDWKPVNYAPYTTSDLATMMPNYNSCEIINIEDVTTYSAEFNGGIVTNATLNQDDDTKVTTCFIRNTFEISIS